MIESCKIACTVKKSRTFLCILLAGLLVAIQQFGFAHALTHLASPASSTPSRSDTQHPAEEACIECVAFAQIGTGVTSALPQASIAATQFEILATPFRVFDPGFIPAFHSRAPPASV